MDLWLKFDSSNVALDSSLSDEMMLIENGQPKRLPKGRGIYRNWGVFFNAGDSL
jgi:hypothetical protein